ncbi:hypothetical protein SUGI_0189930 [Cryptomeria japonica]|uniref:G-type lectin S-receptor-like serine/threonine-protein kinase At5g35370 n=1 Tax=Cryptomeria japonica TaxID=3369 RepID=UPI002408CE9A|nr:G-type lectin S-receptor-like serine/threonine-protein kinase At5g35370 [Cryptomeria japonica]GLJ12389.1 hypothetical protein SUGI_0189930 [Cryptomeria japonica]
MDFQNTEVKLSVFVLLVFVLIVIYPDGCVARFYVDFIQADFSATELNHVDDGGIFLASQNGTFNLQLDNPENGPDFYVCVVHSQSNVVVWTANRAAPISNSDQFILTQAGASIKTTQGRILWSAKGKNVGNLQLRDDGNLVMRDLSNGSVWESFDHPTDTLLPGQRLVLGSNLISNAAEDDFSVGNYEVLLTENDLLLRWRVQGFDQETYWSMAGDSSVIKLRSSAAFTLAYAALEQSGLNLYANSSSSSSASSSMVLQIPISSNTALTRAVIEPSGNFEVLSFISGRWLSEMEAVEEKCLLPATCGPLGICLGLSNSQRYQCSCPAGFQMVNQSDPSQGCKGPQSPNCSSNYGDLLVGNSIDFIKLGGGLDYFALKFETPIKASAIQDCQQICLKNCSCTAFFFDNASVSCYFNGPVGTIRSTSKGSQDAYFKVISGNTSGEKQSTAQLLPIMLGVAAAIFISFACVALIVLRYRKRISHPPLKKAATPDCDNEDENLLLSIPGLPTRFNYAELQSATDNFKYKIGSGGFGTVYQGTLLDNTRVAVKKLQSLLGQGKKEFYSEIATIGSIHHVNLVKLRGFCAEGSNRLLVYEYMNRGSLDRSLFGGPVLEWQERYEIALATARGLSYLHHGCREKIIHCDIKPENILLDDKLETKVSDFGLAKLLSREESQAFTTMRGTRGYLAPEWLTNSAISDKTDVYSYGMLVLEIVGGRKNSLTPESGAQAQDTFNYFPTHALRLCEERRFSEVADPRLEGRFQVDQVEKLVKIALCCVHEDSNLRPTMSKVVHMLEGNVEVDDPQVDSLMFLKIYARTLNNSPMEKTPMLSTTRTVNKYSPMTSYANNSMISSVQVSGPR